MEIIHYYDMEATSMISYAKSGFTFRVTRSHQFANLAMSVGVPEIYPPESCPELSPDILAHPDELARALEDFLSDIGVVPHFILSMISNIASGIPREFTSQASGISREFTSQASAIPRSFPSYFNMDVTLYLFSMEKDCSGLDREESPPFGFGTGGDPCSICLEDINDDGNTESISTMLPCFHVFHIKCLVRWLCSGSATCPLCRHNVDLLT